MSLWVETVEKEACTGCGTCENICPVEAISMETDQEGFWYPAVNEEKCAHCGKCLKVCPSLQTADAELEAERKRQVKVYAAWTLDQEIRYHSTSGGIFSELAMAVMDQGGFVSGAVYDEQKMVRHVITNRKQEIEKLRQSKYVQSDSGTIYREIGRLLQKEEEVLFCGTPCQCEGLLRFCQEEEINIGKLYVIDFICRGSNSPKVYRKFLDELETQYGGKAAKVWFKNKTYGWNRFSTKIDFENGSCYLQDRDHDFYIRGYIEENLYIRPSCSNCGFKGLHRIADMTLADFWGIQLKDRMQESDGGTSLVMVHTEKGKRLWELISSRIYKTEKKFEDVAPGNDCFEHSIRHGVHRSQFMKDLDRMSVIENIQRFLKKNDN